MKNHKEKNRNGYNPYALGIPENEEILCVGELTKGKADPMFCIEKMFPWSLFLFLE